MRPDQCGTGRDSQFMDPGDRAAIVAFINFLESGAPEHLRAIAEIRTGAADVRLQRQLLPSPPYRIGDLVKIIDGCQAGRVGVVASVFDYRHLHTVGGDNSNLLTFLFAVEPLAWRKGQGLFEAHEIGALFGPAGDWVKTGRVVSRPNWPHSREY